MKDTIKIAYSRFCKFEEVLSGILLCTMTGLVFLSAIMRYLGMPIIWATDISTFCFAWEVFIGGDIVVRNTGLGGVELIANKLPSKIQKALKILWFALIIAFCGFLVVYGVDLCFSNTKRTFDTLALSYSWCTLSVPVGGFLMIISSVNRLREAILTPASFWKQASRGEMIKEEVQE